jgi:hypothetical protein
VSCATVRLRVSCVGPVRPLEEHAQSAHVTSLSQRSPLRIGSSGRRLVWSRQSSADSKLLDDLQVTGIRTAPSDFLTESDCRVS